MIWSSVTAMHICHRMVARLHLLYVVSNER